jgi:hypothetical protein
MRRRAARIAVLFGIMAAIAGGIVPAVYHQSAPKIMAYYCPPPDGCPAF